MFAFILLVLSMALLSFPFTEAYIYGYYKCNEGTWSRCCSGLYDGKGTGCDDPGSGYDCSQVGLNQLCCDYPFIHQETAYGKQLVLGCSYARWEEILIPDSKV